jgi:hypothetical protein
MGYCFRKLQLSLRQVTRKGGSLGNGIVTLTSPCCECVGSHGCGCLLRFAQGGIWV